MTPSADADAIGENLDVTGTSKKATRFSLTHLTHSFIGGAGMVLAGVR
jgi:hypothetical protein